MKKIIAVINAILFACLVALVVLEVSGLLGVMRFCRGGCDFTGMFGG